MNNSRDKKEGMIQLLITGVRVGLVAATITAILSMITFAQTTKPTIENAPTATKKVATSDSLKHDKKDTESDTSVQIDSLKYDKKDTESDTSVQIDSPLEPSVFAAIKVEIQRRVNELRREQLDNHEKYIDYWLAAIAIVLTFFGIVVTIAGHISFRRFREIETEAKKNVTAAAEHAEEAERLIDQIRENRDKSVAIIQGRTAEDVADEPEEVEQAVANILENPTTSLTDKAIAQAIFLQQQDKRDEAIEKWRTVAHIAEGIDNDQAARAWFSIGYLLRNSEESILAYDRAISLKSDFAEAYNNRGAVKTELNQYDDAIADYDEAIRLKPDFAEAYYNRGVAKAGLERFIDAIADYDEAIRLKSDYVDAYNNRGAAKAALGQYDDAIADYDEAIGLNPNLSGAYYNRGIAKVALGRHEEAIVDYDEAIRLKPDDAETYYNRGIAKDERGRYEEAIADYDEAIRLKADFVEAYTSRGTAKGALGQPEDAIADYDEAIRLNSDYTNAYYNRGTTKIALSHYEDAISDFDEAIRLNPDYADTYINRGIAKGELKRIDEARQDFERARDLARDAGNDSTADAAEQLLRALDSQEDE